MTLQEQKASNMGQQSPQSTSASALQQLNGNHQAKSRTLGILWWSSGEDSVLPLQEAWVQTLVGKLRSRKPCGAAKKEKKRIK